jgi:hypothetical protein
MLAVPEIGGWPKGGYFYRLGNAISHSDFAGEPRTAPLLPPFGDAPRNDEHVGSGTTSLS